MGIVVVISLVVPLALLLGIALPRAATAGEFLLGLAALGAGLLFAWLVFPWDMTSHHLRLLLPVFALVAAVVGWRRVGTRRDGPPPAWQRVAGGVINLTLLLLLGALCLQVLAGHRVPPDAIELEPPLRDGRYVVGQGGASPFINAHYPVTPQNHAIDIVALDVAGRRAAWGAAADELDAYEVFGDSVYAPCDGVVRVAVDGLPDLPIGERDRDNLAGNHVVVDCGPAEVVLAHLREGSVSVSPGEAVTPDTRLGAVGNSGNTSEPHLHLHAETGGAPGVVLDGEAVPILIDGRYLVRGDIL